VVRSLNSSNSGRSQSSEGGSRSPSQLSTGHDLLYPGLSNILHRVGWGFVFAGVVALSGTLGATLALLAPFQLAPRVDGQPSFSDLFGGGFQHGISRPVNILVMGIDQGMEAKEPGADKPASPFQSRSDTMLLVRLNPDLGKVSVLTIPRDTRVEIPGIGVTKINHANWKGGPALAEEVVSETLNGVEIDRYVRISPGAIRDIVDTLGGVDIYVPEDMQYEDKTQKLKIDLKKGQQKLNGVQAEGFLRFRNDSLGDIGRTQRQQMLLKALQKQIQNPLVLPRIPQVFSAAQTHLDTNLSLGELLALAQFGMQTKSDQLQMALLPGRFSAPDEFDASYWVMDQSKTSKIMATYFEVQPDTAADPDALPMETAAADVKITLQNASGDPDAVAKMSEYLQKAGFSYLEAADEDWPQSLSKTQVVAQWGNLDEAKKLQQLVESSEVSADSTGNLNSDITIRIGKDWVRQQSKKTTAEP
jgi:polyisoprenyl-teichoic acid--peptidoglycan teichoic acid transferase